ncbi:MAG: S9 family peptidase [Candidatus Aminicenantes bacterium]|nr:S9 family peptidase [Candidatus Aminicenantes bacterium]
MVLKKCIYLLFGLCFFGLFQSRNILMAGSRSFTLDQILSSPFPSQLTANQSDTKLAWIFNKQGIHNIWGAEAQRLKSRQLTQFDEDDGQSIHIIGFFRGGRSIVFAKGSPFNPNHRPEGSLKPVLYELDWDSGEICKIAEAGNGVIDPGGKVIAFAKGGGLWLVRDKSEPRKTMSVRGTIRNISWSPHGNKILMQTVRGQYPYQYSYILLYELKQMRFKFIDASVYFDTDPVWSPDGKHIAYVRRLIQGQQNIITARKFPVPDPWEIRIKDLTTGVTTVVWRSPDSDCFRSASVAWINNQHLVFTSEADGWQHIYAVAIRSRQVKQLTKGKFEVEAYACDPELETIFLTSNANDIDRRHIWKVDLDGQMTMVTRGDSIEWNPVITGDHRFLAFFGSTAIKPAQVYVKSLGSQKITKLAPEALPRDFPKALVVPTQVIFKSADGWTIHGQLFLPPKKFSGKRPAIMYFHGGPTRQMLLGFHYSSYYHYCYAMNQYLCSKGYVILVVNYRLGIGYGRAFRDVANGGPRGCSEYQDLLAGAKYLRNHPRVDQMRMGLWGGSYGGLMTALGLARNSELFAAGVDFHGVHDWNQWQAWAEDRESDNHRIVWKSSPLADIQSWRSPVLLIHGDDDRNVPFSETMWLTEKLSEQGVYYELLVFPDEVHSFLLHRNWLNAFKKAAHFFERKLKNKSS